MIFKVTSVWDKQATSIYQIFWMNTTRSKTDTHIHFLIFFFRFLMQIWTLERSNISFGNKVETWHYITDYSTGDRISVIGHGPTSFTNTTLGDTVPRLCTRSWPLCQGSRDHIWRSVNLKKTVFYFFFKDTVLSYFVLIHRTKFCCRCGMSWPNVVVKAMQGDIFVPLVTAIIHTPLIMLERYLGMYVHFLVGLSVKVCIL